MSSHYTLSEERTLAEKRIDYLLDRLMHADEAEAASIHAAVARLKEMLDTLPQEGTP